MEPITASTSVPLSDERVPAFDELYREHRDRVFAWALRYGAGRVAWAEDLTHDVFLQLHRHLARLETDDLGGWLYRVTANTALSRLRSEASWLGRLTRLLSFRDDEGERPDDAFERKDDAAAALRTLHALPPKERMVISMAVLDGLSQREIARTLRLSEGYVSKLLTRAWSRIRAAGWEVDHGP
ncbi:MAG: RNA polymerase sigma factor [Myxococcota bacterium]